MFTFPFTSKAYPGLVVPIPTFPPSSTKIPLEALSYKARPELLVALIVLPFKLILSTIKDVTPVQSPFKYPSVIVLAPRSRIVILPVPIVAVVTPEIVPALRLPLAVKLVTPVIAPLVKVTKPKLCAPIFPALKTPFRFKLLIVTRPLVRSQLSPA